MSGSGTKISSDSGAISITGTGQGTGFNNYGIIQQSSAQVSTTSGKITYTGMGAGTDDAIRTEFGSNIIGDNTSGKITLTSTNNGITLDNVTVKTTNNITINSPGNVIQNNTGGLFADGLELQGTGAYTLTNPNNDIAKLAANGTGNIKYTDVNGFAIGTVNTTNGVNVGANNLTLKAGGAVTQSEAITASGLELLGSGSYDLDNTSNNISTLAANTNNIKYTDTDGFAIGTVNTVGIDTNNNNLTLKSNSTTDTITFTQNVTTGTGNLVVEAGTIDQTGGVITTTGTASFTATKANTGNVIAKNVNAGGTVLGTSEIGGDFTLTSTGNVTQAGGATLKVAGKTTITAPGATTTNPGNVLPYYIDPAGNVTIEKVGSINLSAQTVTGNLSVTSLASGNAYASVFSGSAINLNQANSFGGTVSFNTKTDTYGATSGTPGISQSGAQTVAGTSTFNAVGGTITLNDASNTFTGAVTLNTGATGGNISFTNNATTSLGNVTTANTANVTLNISGATTQVTGTAITAGGLELLGSGSYDLDNTSNNISTLAANTNNIKYTDTDGFAIGTVNTVGVNTGGNLTLTAGGAVTQSEAITASGLELTGATATYTLTNPNNDITTLAVSTNNNFSYTDISGFAIGTVGSTSGISAPGKDVTLTAGGAVTQSEAITASGLELLGSGSYDLDNTSNNISTLAANTNNFIKYTDTNGFAIGTVNTTNGVNVGANNLTLKAGGAVTQSEAITAGGLELLGSGSYTLTNATNNINTLAANTTNNIKYTDTDGFAIGTVNTVGVNTGGNLTLTAGGAVTQSQAITASGLELLGSGSYDLDNTSNNISTLAANTNNFIKYTDTNGFAIGTVNTTNGVNVGANNLTLKAGGAVTQSEAITAGGLELLGSGSYTLTNATNNINTLAANTTNNIKYTDTDGFAIGTVNTVGVNTGGNLTLTAGGAVTQSQAITASGLELLGSGSYDLDNTSNNISTLAANTNNIKYTDTDGFAIGTVNTTNGVNVGANNLTLKAGGAVTQSEAITASGLELLGSGSYTLTNATNDINTLAANTTNDIKYTDANGFAIGTVNTVGVNTGGNNLTLTAGGAVTQSQAITASGLELTGATATYTLTNPNNDITTLAVSTNNNFSYTDISGFDIGTVGSTNGISAPGKDVTLTAGGAVTQTQKITASGLELKGTGSYTLTNTSNDISTLAANTTNDIKYTDTNGFVVGTVNTTNGISSPGKNVTLTAGGAVTQTQKITASGLELKGTGSYTLTNTSNDISTLAANTTNDIKYTDTNGFVVGTVNTTNGISAPGKNVTLTAGGAVTQTQKITTGGLELSGSGNYTFTNASNNVQTLTVKTSGNVNYQDADALSFNTVGIVGGLDLDAVGSITQTSNVTSTGKVDIASLSGSILASGKDITTTTTNKGILLTATSGVITAGNLTTQGGQVGIQTSAGLIQVGDVKTNGGQISVISPSSIKTGILNSSGNISITGNGVQVDHIIGGSGSVSIFSSNGFKATGQNSSGFSIQTTGGLIDIQYAPSGIFKVGSTAGNGTQGKITNGFITLDTGLTFICFPSDCGVFKNMSIRTTDSASTSQKSKSLEDASKIVREVLPTLTLREVPTRQILDVSEVLRTQLDVATEEAILSLDVAFGAEFANYLGVKPANTLRSAADVRKLLEDIYKQTGRKTAIIYWVLDQLYLNIVLITPGVPQGVAQNQGVLVASVDLATGLVQQPKTAPLTYRGVPTARRDEVIRVINRFRNQVADRRLVGNRDYLKDAQALHRWLIEPIEPELQAQGIDTLLVVPDKGIRLLPLGALYDGKQFLIEKYNVAMTPSINLISTRYRPLQGAEVLAMGASTFANESPLPSVPTELKTITNIWPGRYFLNQDFTPERLMQERKAGQFRMVHLATHAFFKPGDLSESYIVFGNNQKLPVTKLPDLSLQGVELFSLGACRTLIGDGTDPTVEFGFAGLAVKTGVETAVASLWNVEDTATMALMTEFYRSLQKTPIKAEALRQAQLALMQGQTKVEGGQLRLVTRSGQSIPLPPELTKVKDLDFSHPYFWSGFSMIGSPW
ncbi:CHAT domain-containing protein [Gloeomargaritales cyanobacterium VI4D9]|nr:CHAT domain-containing protein [Gloeomargaritales cyanobacterium VI4D9]